MVKNKFLILQILQLFCLISCESSERIQEVKKIEKVNFQGKEFIISKVDSSSNHLIESDEFSGVIFSKDYKVYKNFSFRISDKNYQRGKVISFTPTLKDIVEAEDILKRCVEIDKIDADSIEIYEGKIYDLSKYYRQYFGAINEKGHKLIWVNSFLKPATYLKDWKVKLVVVDDGGKAFFNVVINTKTGQCYSFFRNSIGG